jgi:hypothetical protein
MAGETTSLAASALLDARLVPEVPGPQLTAHEITVTYSATNQLELNDVMEACYLPIGIKIWMIGITATDMDTNGSPLLTQKITVGSTDVLTGINDGRAATSTLYQLPAVYTTTGLELVKITNTAAAATAAAGSLKVRFYYTCP